MRIAALFLILACAAPSAARAPSDPEPPPGLRGMLAAHNRLRAKHCAPPLQWSDELARVAQRWAERLRKSGCTLEHSGGRYGENLAAATVGALASEDAVSMWYAEKDAYRYDRPGFRPETGHFTQLVWAGSKKLGCGTASCRDMQLWVCNYDPPGNVEGDYRRNVLPESCRKGR